MAYTTVDDPTIYFNTVLYTGNSTDDRTVTGVGFQPDWVWIKDRSNARVHYLADRVRGDTKYLQSQATTAEITSSSALKSIDSDGFTTGTSTTVNSNGETYVVWNWKAGGSASSNSDGSITTSVSANTTAGFSIVTYTLGSGSGSTTQGHGLGAVPHVIINKSLDQTYNWQIYHHKNTSAPETERLKLNATDATEDNNKPWNDTAPTSSVFTHGDSSWNGTGDHVSYCFIEKKGYSKFGSYTGNGNTDGIFIYTGFRPAWFMYKSTSSTQNWIIQDNKRANPFNEINADFRANLSDAENTSTSYNDIDFLSNGIKLREDNNDQNQSSGTYIYMAFAESPLVNSNGVPNNAR